MAVITLSLGFRTPTLPPTDPMRGSAKQAVSSRIASGWKMQSESIEMITSAVECCSALQTERAFPLLTSFRPVLMRMLVKSRCALSIHS
jgi:hypothetical protein